MELQERKKKILQAVIRNYLETGEPVGSRTIAKDSDLKLSSATIRNEMQDLEEMGLLTSPHTSAGRIPTDQGYRVYVDDMLQSERQEVRKMQNVLIQKQDHLETLLQQVSKMLASNTEYASMVSAPAIRKNKIKFIQLSQIDLKTILAVIVIEGNIVRNKMIHVEQPLDAKTVLQLNLLLNNSLCGLAVEEIDLKLITQIKLQAGVHSGIVSNVIDAAAEAIVPDKEPRIYTSGAPNIFKYPELSGDNAGRLISDFEEKQALTSIVRESLQDNTKDGQNAIQVYIGDQMPESMKDCSAVTATYDLGDGMKGTIGVIGPKRMDYDKVFSVLKNIMEQLDTLYRKE
ncbi:MAG TPA: heat-inducible transcription repressor HrcA [Lachnospiraceae bacterium]|jgi:heat-inducible transcriptional repressor|nr:heat-inducible transcription repressor HrcA [Lachnospiraceae bacterium]